MCCFLRFPHLSSPLEAVLNWFLHIFCSKYKLIKVLYLKPSLERHFSPCVLVFVEARSFIAPTQLSTNITTTLLFKFQQKRFSYSTSSRELLLMKVELLEQLMFLFYLISARQAAALYTTAVYNSPRVRRLTVVTQRGPAGSKPILAIIF